jgi:hypothetical protein
MQHHKTHHNRLWFFFLMFLIQSCSQQRLDNRSADNRKPGDNPEEWDTYISQPSKPDQPTSIDFGGTQVRVAQGGLPEGSRIRLKKAFSAAESQQLAVQLGAKENATIVSIEIVDAAGLGLPSDQLGSPVEVSETFRLDKNRLTPSWQYFVDDDARVVQKIDRQQIKVETIVDAVSGNDELVRISTEIRAAKFTYALEVEALELPAELTTQVEAEEDFVSYEVGVETISESGPEVQEPDQPSLSIPSAL